MPPLRFDFLSPPRIAFGWGRRTEVGGIARSLGRRAFLVSGSRTLAGNGTLAEIESLLMAAGIGVTRIAECTREPEVADVDAAVRELRQHSPGPNDLVIAVGGGSAIDLAKAVAALAPDGREASVSDFLEGVGKGFKIERPPLPVLAMPTTAGAGSEATKNAVISSSDPPFKKSLRSDLMVPRAVLVDPELTVSVPPAVTAHTGMDAITQLIESYLSRRAQPIPQALALSGLALALPSIVTAVTDGTNRTARERMAYAALLSGLSLANSGLGLAHGVAAALGIQCHIPHGLACAVMLPAALRVNRAVRSEEIARLWSVVDPLSSLSVDDAAERFIARIEELSAAVGVPRQLSKLGVRRDQIAALVKGSRGNSTDGNPRDVTDGELQTLLEGML